MFTLFEYEFGQFQTKYTDYIIIAYVVAVTVTLLLVLPNQKEKPHGK